ncbi:LOW QUALITY PROTEIN: hypothetical protein PHMEG_00021508 [Phytophthora megakarya]|uniref:Uncharacterized protein n=1 Tax=Phytophthora megakarya TaxID=4795 RepID=A0A225VL18_9STRA|nr:LOW QUALITY PROTEIN: hypothetical protein PHMEG_00021508 [Phytophthora megakarya]
MASTEEFTANLYDPLLCDRVEDTQRRKNGRLSWGHPAQNLSNLMIFFWSVEDVGKGFLLSSPKFHYQRSTAPSALSQRSHAAYRLVETSEMSALLRLQLGLQHGASDDERCLTYADILAGFAKN